MEPDEHADRSALDNATLWLKDGATVYQRRGIRALGPWFVIWTAKEGDNVRDVFARAGYDLDSPRGTGAYVGSSTTPKGKYYTWLPAKGRLVGSPGLDKLGPWPSEDSSKADAIVAAGGVMFSISDSRADCRGVALAAGQRVMAEVRAPRTPLYRPFKSKAGWPRPRKPGALATGAGADGASAAGDHGAAFVVTATQHTVMRDVFPMLTPACLVAWASTCRAMSLEVDERVWKGVVVAYTKLPEVLHESAVRVHGSWHAFTVSLLRALNDVAPLLSLPFAYNCWAKVELAHRDAALTEAAATSSTPWRGPPPMPVVAAARADERDAHWVDFPHVLRALWAARIATLGDRLRSDCDTDGDTEEFLYLLPPGDESALEHHPWWVMWREAPEEIECAGFDDDNFNYCSQGLTDLRDNGFCAFMWRPSTESTGVLGLWRGMTEAELWRYIRTPDAAPLLMVEHHQMEVSPSGIYTKVQDHTTDCVLAQAVVENFDIAPSASGPGTPALVNVTEWILHAVVCGGLGVTAGLPQLRDLCWGYDADADAARKLPRCRLMVGNGDW